ncbi:uncharacterized protein LOC121415591 [Lytechinus variegatus]|uniref:uncharacterized protein LOC121415591 n=1 Tax=Lytechinus variegatus TaxID=7654 RepID=UPI001BB1F98F|nr:uncharacterized protein LOC121415591 [Lytechinus variegatus]
MAADCQKTKILLHCAYDLWIEHRKAYASKLDNAAMESQSLNEKFAFHLLELHTLCNSCFGPPGESVSSGLRLCPAAPAPSAEVDSDNDILVSAMNIDRELESPGSNLEPSISSKCRSSSINPYSASASVKHRLEAPVHRETRPAIKSKTPSPGGTSPGKRIRLDQPSESDDLYQVLNIKEEEQEDWAEDAGNNEQPTDLESTTSDQYLDGNSSLVSLDVKLPPESPEQSRLEDDPCQLKSAQGIGEAIDKGDTEPVHETRTPYKRISDDDRRRVVEAFEGNEQDYLEMADNLGIKRSTARSIVRTYLETGRAVKLPRGGARNSKMDEEVRNYLRAAVESNPRLTLSQMKDKLQEDLPQKPDLSMSTIARALDGMLVSLTLTEDAHCSRNSPRVLQQRREYAEWFVQRSVVAHCVFIDEYGYNIWTRRTQGRNLQGTSARRIVHGQRGHNCNVMLAVSATVGLVHSEIDFGTVTHERFERFLGATSTECNKLFPENAQIVFIYDSAKPHLRANLPVNVHAVMEAKILPPFSPFLNIAEMAHCAFKDAVMTCLAQPAWQCRIEDKMGAEQSGVNLQQWRSNLLKEIAEQCIDTITPAKCTQWFNHSKTYLPMCLNSQEITGKLLE